MGFSALQIILVFVWVFIVAIDQFDFLESLYQPIVSGAVIGAILGDLLSSGYHRCCRSGSSLRSDRPVHGYLPVHPHVPHDVQG